jgi:hypothetical protein
MQTLNLSEYANAWYDMVEKILDRYHMLDPLLQFFPPFRSSHTGPYRYVQRNGASEFNLETVRYGATGSVDIRVGDIKGHTAFLHDFAQSYLKVVGAQNVAKMFELTETLGNRVGEEGQSFTVENFLEALEKLYIRFIGDEELQLILMTHPEIPLTKGMYMAPKGAVILFVNPEKEAKLREASWTLEQRQRYNEVIARKRAEQRAAKRTRRLP